MQKSISRIFQEWLGVNVEWVIPYVNVSIVNKSIFWMNDYIWGILQDWFKVYVELIRVHVEWWQSNSKWFWDALRMSRSKCKIDDSILSIHIN